VTTALIFFSAARLAAGANPVNYSRSTVANAEVGRQRVGADFWALCDTALGCGDILSRGYAEVQAIEHADRLQAVTATRYQSLAATFPRDDANEAEPSWPADDAQTGDGKPVLETASARDPMVVRWLGDQLGGYARAAGMFGGRDLLTLMIRHVRFLRSGLGSAHGPERAEIVGVCARYAEFIGWLYQDIGRHGDATFWTDRALEWARDAGDTGFEAYVLMRQSDLAEGHLPSGTVLSLAEAARRVPSLGPRGTALITQQEATGYALDGNTAGFERAIEHARAQAAAAAMSEDAPWGLYCTPAYVAMQEATGWMQLSQPAKAVTVFEHKISDLPATDRVDAAVYRARLARAYQADHRPDCAGQAALTAFDLAAATGSSRARSELAQVRKLIGRKPETDPAARFAAAFDASPSPAEPREHRA
jgi:hypothetical protein